MGLGDDIETGSQGASSKEPFLIMIKSPSRLPETYSCSLLLVAGWHGDAAQAVRPCVDIISCLLTDGACACKRDGHAPETRRVTMSRIAVSFSQHRGYWLAPPALLNHCLRAERFGRRELSCVLGDSLG
jgi:hypothetical protein